MWDVAYNVQKVKMEITTQPQERMLLNLELISFCLCFGSIGFIPSTVVAYGALVAEWLFPFSLFCNFIISYIGFFKNLFLILVSRPNFVNTLTSLFLL